jgi:hypothetical protein
VFSVVLRYLSLRDILECMAVCKSWYTLVPVHAPWALVSRREFGVDVVTLDGAEAAYQHVRANYITMLNWLGMRQQGNSVYNYS